MNSKILTDAQNKGLITFGKPCVVLFLTKTKASESHYKTLSRLLIETSSIPYPPVEPKDFDTDKRFIGA